MHELAADAENHKKSQIFDAGISAHYFRFSENQTTHTMTRRTLCLALMSLFLLTACRSKGSNKNKPTRNSATSDTRRKPLVENAGSNGGSSSHSPKGEIGEVLVTLTKWLEDTGNGTHAIAVVLTNEGDGKMRMEIQKTNEFSKKIHNPFRVKSPSKLP